MAEPGPAQPPGPPRRDRLEQLFMGMKWTVVAGYAAVGAWCLVHPASFQRLWVPPEEFGPPLEIRCFGTFVLSIGLSVTNMCDFPEHIAWAFTSMAMTAVPWLEVEAWAIMGMDEGKMLRRWMCDMIRNLVFGAGALDISHLYSLLPRRRRRAQPRPGQ